MATRFFVNASWSGFSAAVRVGAGLLVSLLAIRLLGVDIYGHVATWLSLFVMYLSLNSSAFTMLAVRLVEVENGGQQADREMAIAAAATFGLGSVFLLATLTLLLSACAMCVPQFWGGLAAEFGETLLLMGLLTVFQIAVALQAAVIEGAGRLDLASRWQLFGPLIIVILLAFALMTGISLAANQYLAVLCAGAFVDLSLLWFVRRTLTLPILASTRRIGRMKDVWQLLRSGGILQATSLMNLFLEPANKFLLNHFAGAATVTIYDLVMRVVWGIQYLFGAAMRVFLHIGSQGRDAVSKNFAKATNLLGVPAVVLHIVGAIFVFWTAIYWMAVDTRVLMIFFGIAAISNLGMIFITPLYLGLIGRRDLGFIFRTQAVLAAVNVGTSAALIPLIGLVGAAFGLLGATVLNAASIYLRSRVDREVFAGERGNMPRLMRRSVMALVLLMATIAWGAMGGGSYLALFGIFVGLTAIMIGEPLVNLLAARFIPKQPWRKAR